MYSFPKQVFLSGQKYRARSHREIERSGLGGRETAVVHATVLCFK